MQLLKVRMAGFKSFVDPTIIMLPSKLVAIVGPNGCGKSNIIDAVTWVMGESSPKYLRGESLTDVIFNGSTARKSVGQASVELVFDNQEGTIGGEYAKFAEISVKRIINRDSDSVYYLNGVRCRKRDVVDIFLGTGLGPRSYSIIGQNMINKIIEAKPDDLRHYFEEAAGISKYKERRRETELRMGHTRENLSRVSDLQTELEKQLSSLQHQAKMAEKFKLLKQQERELRAELYGIQWQQFEKQMADASLRIQCEETVLAARQSEISRIERDLEQMRQQQRTANEQFQEVQRRYYAAGSEITRFEQDILHHQERQEQWENDLQQVDSDWHAFNSQMVEAEDSLDELTREIQQREPQWARANQEIDALKTQLETAEERVQTWQKRWDVFNQAIAKTTQTTQVEQTRIQHLEQRVLFLQQQQDQRLRDKDEFHFDALNKELQNDAEQSDDVDRVLAQNMQQLTGIRQEVDALHAMQQVADTALDDLRGQLQRLGGQQASLEALQQTALGQRDRAVSDWLAQYHLDVKSRLAQVITVEEGWETAAEKVLGFCLQAVCVDQLSEVIPYIDTFQSGYLCICAATPAVTQTHRKKGTLLLEKIKSAWPLDSFLSGIYVADSLSAALALSASLEMNESVITREGVWLSRSWLKMLRETDPAAGVFQREEELKQLAHQLEQLQTMQSEMEEKIAERRQKIQGLEQQSDQLQKEVQQQQAQSAQLSAQQKIKQERLVELRAQFERCIKSIDECHHQLQQTQSELEATRLLWQEAFNELQHQEQARHEWIKERDQVQQQLQTLRVAYHQKKEEMHELEISLQTLKAQKGSSQQNRTRIQNQLIVLSERREVLQQELDTMPQMDTLKQSLSHALDKHVSVEEELNTARIALESLEQECRCLEEKRQATEHQAHQVRHALESLRMEWQGWKVKADTAMDQVQETGLVLEDLLKRLPQETTPEEWQAKLDQVTNHIHRLGSINLIAIEEYATCLERKQYLDKQVEDLQSGLTLLESAMAKIDKETRAKFKETFDRVNERFQELFPTIFGGGKAYLELNSDHLLEAGVTMMACPPGKRNSSVYLLSGGEKSLTAIALIFSIFHLNPAPFCLLDEVDAALDDANVLRFTRLIKMMADKTQFLFISHNKITIEVGEYLIGVTMNEPGISRLVSVDIEKAMSMVEA